MGLANGKLIPLLLLLLLIRYSDTLCERGDRPIRNGPRNCNQLHIKSLRALRGKPSRSIDLHLTRSLWRLKGSNRLRVHQWVDGWMLRPQLISDSFIFSPALRHAVRSASIDDDDDKIVSTSSPVWVCRRVRRRQIPINRSRCGLAGGSAMGLAGCGWRLARL